MESLLLFELPPQNNDKFHLPADIVVVSEPSVGLDTLIGDGVVKGVLGKLSNGASGWFMSYRNSGMIGTRKNNYNI